jgi:Tol biopolymer transport system component
VTMDDRGRRAADRLRRIVDSAGVDWLDRFERHRSRRERNQRLGVALVVALIAVPAFAFAMQAFREHPSPVTQPRPSSGVILFGDWDPQTSLAHWFAIRPDGTGLRDLPITATCAQWWPDGSKLWITNDASNPLRPATVALDGSQIRLLSATRDPRLNLGCGDVSPDGTRMVLEGFNEEQPWGKGVDGLYSVRASDGGGLVRLTHGGDSGPEYSPDGSRVVFFRSKSSHSAGALFVIHTDGTGLRRVTPFDATLVQTWSPDGRWIAFADRMGQLFLVRPDGTDLHQIPVSLPAGASASQPSWSPDGSWIAFSMRKSGDADIYVVRPDGTGLHLIAGGPGQQVNPVWGPRSG